MAKPRPTKGVGKGGGRPVVTSWGLRFKSINQAVRITGHSYVTLSTAMERKTLDHLLRRYEVLGNDVANWRPEDYMGLRSDAKNGVCYTQHLQVGPQSKERRLRC